VTLPSPVGKVSGDSVAVHLDEITLRAMWRIYRENGFRKLGGPIPLTRSPSFVISVPRLRPQVIPDDRKEAKTYFRKTGFGRRRRGSENGEQNGEFFAGKPGL
jgi:hypothetical protein